MKTLKALGEYTHTHTHTHTHTQYIYQTAGKIGSSNVLVSNAKAYFTYINFNFLTTNNEDGETM